MPSNLPPGVTVSNLPGSRPEDIEWDDFIEQIDEDLSRLGISVREAKELWRQAVSIYTTQE